MVACLVSDENFRMHGKKLPEGMVQYCISNFTTFSMNDPSLLNVWGICKLILQQ